MLTCVLRVTLRLVANEHVNLFELKLQSVAGTDSDAAAKISNNKFSFKLLKYLASKFTHSDAILQYVCIAIGCNT